MVSINMAFFFFGCDVTKVEVVKFSDSRITFFSDELLFYEVFFGETFQLIGGKIF